VEGVPPSLGVTPIYLVRHAKARQREKWEGPDHLRPLTKSGRRQAQALVDMFEQQPFTRLFTSPYLRCVQTFEPLAESRGLPLESAHELAEGADVESAMALMLAAAGAGPAAFSTHGDLVAYVLDELQDNGVRLADPFALKKGSTWILGVTEGAFTDARYVSPPLAK
jgi:8-oxo-(d)GTP phosphatase